jgi:hypothetical protein
MYFDKLNFGEALAILEGVQEKRITLSDDCFSSTVQTLLNDLQIRTSSVTKTFSSETLHELNKPSVSSKEALLEDCFIYLFIKNKDSAYCDSFYKAITSSFIIFEKFCSIYKDYLNTQSQLEHFNQNQRATL